MDVRALRSLADRCGSAKRLQEDEALLAVQAIVQDRTTLSTIVEFIGAMECRSRREAALVAFDALFPNLEWNMRRRSPIGGLGERFFLGVWDRHNATEARSYDACSLALALCRAIFAELALQIENEARNSCDLCHGVGYFITNHRKHICNHEVARELAS